MSIHHHNISSRYVFSWYPFYFDFHSARIIFDVQNLVLCLNRELIQIIDYRFMLKLQCKTKFNSVFVGKKNHQNEQESILE